MGIKRSGEIVMEIEINRVEMFLKEAGIDVSTLTQKRQVEIFKSMIDSEENAKIKEVEDNIGQDILASICVIAKESDNYFGVVRMRWYKSQYLSIVVKRKDGGRIVLKYHRNKPLKNQPKEIIEFLYNGIKK